MDFDEIGVDKKDTNCNQHCAWSALLKWGLWVSLALIVTRSVLLLGMEHLAQNRELALFRVRLADALPFITLRAVIYGLGAAVLFTAIKFIKKQKLLRNILYAAAWIIGSASFFYMLAGWDSSDISRQVGLYTSRGKLISAILCVASGVLGGLLLRNIIKYSSSVKKGVALELIIPLVIVIVIPIGWSLAFSRLADQMTVWETLRRVTPEAHGWQVLQSHPERGPYMEVICPSTDFQLDGADIYSLVLPPPCRVSFKVKPEEGPLFLDGRVGFDYKTKKYEKMLTGRSVRFTVHVNGDEAFTRSIPIEGASARFPGYEWMDIGSSEEGLLLDSGDEVILATAFDGGTPTPALQAGFGGVFLRRQQLVHRTTSSGKRPNIVLIVMDAQRMDRLSAYGYARATSPNLERLANRGMLFEQAYSTASWTWPSTASLLTGLLPEEHCVVNGDSCFLSHEIETVAEALQRKGFTTAAYSGNPLIVPDRNFNQGFEFFAHTKRKMKKSKYIAPPALEWLESIAGTRFFLYLHLVDTHSPGDAHPEGRRLFASNVPASFPTSSINDYQVQLLDAADGEDKGDQDGGQTIPAYHKQWISDLYDACVWTGDLWVGKFLDKLDKLGLTNETVVIFVSDHGEGLFDHGFPEHGQDLFCEQVRIPLVIAGPGIPEGVRVKQLVSIRQVAPTLANIGGARLSDVHNPIDLIHLKDGLAPGKKPVFFSTTQGCWKGRQAISIYGMRVRDTVYHLMHSDSTEGVSGDAFDQLLFNIALDPNEDNNLSSFDPKLTKALKAALEKRIKASIDRRKGTSISSGESTLEMLRGIGYIGDK